MATWRTLKTDAEYVRLREGLIEDILRLFNLDPRRHVRPGELQYNIELALRNSRHFYDPHHREAIMANIARQTLYYIDQLDKLVAEQDDKR